MLARPNGRSSFSRKYRTYTSTTFDPPSYAMSHTWSMRWVRESTSPGWRISSCRRANSFDESRTSTPARLTAWRAGSRTMSPTVITAGRSTPPRRVSARARANSSVCATGGLAGWAGVPLNARAEVDRVGLAVEDDAAIGLSGHGRRDVRDGGFSRCLVGRCRIAEQLPRKRPLQRVAGCVVGARCVEVVHVAAPEQLEGPPCFGCPPAEPLTVAVPLPQAARPFLRVRSDRPAGVRPGQPRSTAG